MKKIILLILSAIIACASSTPFFNVEFKASSDRKVYTETNNSVGEMISSATFKRGSAANVGFSGMCDYLVMPSRSSGVKFDFSKNSNTLISQNGFSVTFWAYISSTQYKYATFLEALDNNNHKIFEINSFTKDGNKQKGLSFYVGSKKSDDSKTLFEYDKWHHISLVYKPNTGKLDIYENGKIYRTENIGKTNIANIKTLYVGTTENAAYGLIGNMDEVKIFKTALSGSEVEEIYDNELNYRNYDGSDRECMSKICTLTSSIESDPLSDIFGKSVFTKKKNIFTCQYIKEKRGSCSAEDVSTKIKLPEIKRPISYIDTLEGGDLGQIAAIASAETMAESIFSGWKGYCIKGVEEDFSWVSDPYFWGSVALSYASASLASGGSSAGASAAKETTKQVTKETTKQITKETIKEATKKELYKKMAKYAICAAQSGLDLGKMLQNKEVPCDPVDEICDTESKSYDDQAYTLSKQQYNDMLSQNPNFSDYITVTKEADGQVTFMITYNNIDDSLDTTELDNAKKKAEEQMRKIQEACIAFSAALCVGKTALGYSSSHTTSTTDNDAGISAADTAKAIVSTAATAICGPACGAAAQVVGALATSFKQVNTCGNKDDATEKGSRHIDTYNANQMHLCRETRDVCKEKSKVGSGCQLHAKYFCCYDSVSTLLLAEQIKSELGVGWEHCTGFSLNEFIHINFQTCSNTSGIDGTTLPYNATYAQRKQAFQFQDKCLDYTKYIDYIMRTTGGRYNKDSIQELITKK